MIRPDNMDIYEPIDLKLGIKSSLPHVRSALALAILLWECSDNSFCIAYSQTNGDKLVLSKYLQQRVESRLVNICKFDALDIASIIKIINENQLFKSQLESLIVAFELIWKIARVRFEDLNKSFSAERTGGIRYPKVLEYTLNIDIIHSLICNDEDSYVRVLLNWIGVDVKADPLMEDNLIRILNAMSESSVFKLVDDKQDVIFNQCSIYKKLTSTGMSVDIRGDNEPKGSLRILKSLLDDKLNPYLLSSSEGVKIKDGQANALQSYQQRVSSYLQLTQKLPENLTKKQGITNKENGNGIFKKSGVNILLYGVPGCGKSYRLDKLIEEEGIPKSFIRRVVFHPDYTYSDFVGQIMPVSKEAVEGKKIEYTFVPGPFTDILKIAYENPEQKCALIIEELNRGNAPAIFGDLFQLLDREEDPSKENYQWSKYHVTNKDIAENAIFERDDSDYSVKLPPNLAILATMNTSDQNVFSMDTAFQRRWQMQHIRNEFKGEHADKFIEGTRITWKAFATTVNELLTDKSNMFGNSEDKCLGAYFAIDAELDNRQRFAEKVLKYLWDDAFKMDRTPLFDKQYTSLSKLIEDFEDATGDALKVVLQADVYKKMLDKSHSTAEIPADSDVSEITEQE